MLAAREAGVARLWLESLWQAVVDPHPAQRGAAAAPPPPAAVLRGLRGALRDAFGRRPAHRRYVQSLQGFAIADRGSYVPSADAAAAAAASGSLQAGVLQVRSRNIGV